MRCLDDDDWIEVAFARFRHRQPEHKNHDFQSSASDHDVARLQHAMEHPNLGGMLHERYQRVHLHPGISETTRNHSLDVLVGAVYNASREGHEEDDEGRSRRVTLEASSSVPRDDWRRQTTRAATSNTLIVTVAMIEDASCMKRMIPVVIPWF
jgi:hypothetical protein